jgi:hypothetical protein
MEVAPDSPLRPPFTAEPFASVQDNAHSEAQGGQDAVTAVAASKPAAVPWETDLYWTFKDGRPKIHHDSISFEDLSVANGMLYGKYQAYVDKIREIPVPARGQPSGQFSRKVCHNLGKNGPDVSKNGILVKLAVNLAEYRENGGVASGIHRGQNAIIRLLNTVSTLTCFVHLSNWVIH